MRQEKVAVAERRGLKCDSTPNLKFHSCKNRQFIPLKLQSRKCDKWTKKDRSEISIVFIHKNSDHKYERAELKTEL